jgi:IS5 family transposase
VLLGQRADGEPQRPPDRVRGRTSRRLRRKQKRTRDAGDRIAGQPADLGADKGYDTAEFVAACRALKVTPHIARNEGRAGGSALDRRPARHVGYTVSQRVRKRVEDIFGWMKTVGGLRRTRYRGLDRTQLHAYLVAAAYNLLRIARLSAASA